MLPDHVRYFGRDLDHNVLMDAKRRFAERWPERRFTERPDSLHAACDERGVCTVWGLVDWHCSSEQRNATASGTSEFSFQVQDGKAMVAEDGFVVSRGQALAMGKPGPVLETPRETRPPAVRPEPKPAPPAEQASEPAPAVDQAGNYSNDDIPGLRALYLAHSSDSRWIKDWLLSEKTFLGTGRAQGAAATYDLPDAGGRNLQVDQFDSSQGPIACVMADGVPTIAQGADVRIRGIVTFFIDRTMYLTGCSFT